MKTHRVTGAGGVGLHVAESGNPKGRPIVFIHGISQCSLSWSKQMNSSLAEKHRLIALDMRGHGLSDKPRDAYNDSKLWADDLRAVIETLELDHPVLSGWSYGSLVFLDYLRHYGDDRLGGLHFVGGVTKLGSEEALAVLTPEFLALVPKLLSADGETSVQGLEGLLRLCLTQPPSDSELFLMLGYNVSVPSHVRQALLSRAINNDDILRGIRKPVLITHGAADKVVKRAAVDHHKTKMPHAQVHVMPDAGHAPFWENAPAFNERLHAFCDTL